MSYGGRVSETGPDVVRSIIRERVDLSGLLGCPETHGRGPGGAHLAACSEPGVVTRRIPRPPEVATCRC